MKLLDLSIEFERLLSNMFEQLLIIKSFIKLV